MYKIESQTENKRIYRSTISGTTVATFLLYTGEDGSKWWAFEDLLNMPFMRKKASEHIVQMYGTGITPEDQAKFFANMKVLLKKDDPEKYEKVYAEILRMENLQAQGVHPIKQSLALSSVYILADDERIDTFDFDQAAKKTEQWRVQPEMQSFFLNWLSDGISAYTSLYATTLLTASTNKAPANESNSDK